MRARPDIRTGGFTLLEVMIVLAIVALLTGGAVGGFRSFAKSELRGSATRLSGTIRYLFDRASSTGKMHRLVIDFDEGRYWAEESDDRFYVPAGRETEESRQAEAEAIAEEAAAEEAAKSSAFGDPSQDPSQYATEVFKPKRARFAAFREAVLKPSKIPKAVKLANLYTPRLAEPTTTGRGFIYFYPLGMTEASVINLSDADGEVFFSIIVHPLTGRVQVQQGYAEPPVNNQVDDEGTRIEP